MTDYMVRATAADSQIRAFACTARETVEAARQAHDTSPVVTAALGRLLSAGAMMGAMLKGEKDLLTLQVKGDGPMGGMTVTADPAGNVKGYANVPDVILPASSAGKLDVAGAVGSGFLSVIRDMGLREPYVGRTALQTGEIAEDLTYYFAASEQVPSSVGLGVLMDRDNTVRRAGGFIIQLMPFAGDAVVDRLEQNLAGVTSVTELLEQGLPPEGVLEKLMEGFPVEVTDVQPVRFYCGCDKMRVESALVSLGAEELQGLIGEGERIEVNCQFCGRSYTLSPQELETLYRTASVGLRR